MSGFGVNQAVRSPLESSGSFVRYRLLSAANAAVLSTPMVHFLYFILWFPALVLGYVAQVKSENLRELAIGRTSCGTPQRHGFRDAEFISVCSRDVYGWISLLSPH
jgi:hypothetical protein